jgi:eukaryotic-like serine/threonine-protein kinase
MSQQDVFGDRYQMVSHIARGGMAQVYLAQDLLLDRPVALKVLFPELSVDRAFVERFRREAKAAANLTHPNIVSIYDWGQGEHTYFIVMEYVDGQTLSSVLRQGPMDATRAASIGADVAAALEFAHRRGVIHRDVKPGNVLIDNSGRVKVADFGIARANGADGDLTQTGSVMGTATYFSPEQAQGLPVDARSDVYSLGVVLYEMVSGKPPFAGDNPVSIAYKHVKEPVPSPRQNNPEIPANFEAIVMKAMAKEADNRYQSAEELRADLVRFANGQPVVAAAAADVTRVATAVGAGAALGAAGAAAVLAGDPTRVQAAAGGTATLPVTPGGMGPDGQGPDGESPEERRGRIWMYSGLAALLVVLLAAGYFGGKAAGWWGSSTKSLTIPTNLVNQSAATAQSELKGMGFTNVSTKQEASSQVKAGNVISVTPAPGTTIKSDQAVVLAVSSGPAPVRVPDVAGHPVAAATAALQAAGFVANTTQQASTTVAQGVVISTNPPGGQSAGQGSAIQVVVSTGQPQVTIPPVVGEDPATAGNQLGALGLKVTTLSESSSTITQGNVTRTSPPAGTPVTQGSTVTVYVSTGPPTVAVPDVRHDTQALANAAIGAAGLVPNFIMQPVSNPNQNGVVLSQSPAGGTQVQSGSTVNVVIGQFQTTTTTTTTTTPNGNGGPPST